MTMSTELKKPTTVVTVQAAAQPDPRSSLPGLPFPCLIPVALTAMLLWAAFHPLSWGPLAWIALVPLLCLVRSHASSKRIYWSAWIGGSLFFWTVLQWMRVADVRMYATWAMLACYCSLYFPLAIYLVRLCERRTRLPLVVTFPVVWIALEYFRSFFLTGFPWYLLAHSQHDFLPIIQITDLTGAYGVSFLIAAVNALVFDIAFQIPSLRSFLKLQEPVANPGVPRWGDFGASFFSWRNRLTMELVAVAFFLGLAFGYGVWQLGQTPFTNGPTVALLQTNIDQRIRNTSSVGAKTEMTDQYAALTGLAMRYYPKPDLVVGPETSFPLLWMEVARELPLSDVPEPWRANEVLCRNALRNWAAGTGTNHLLGVESLILDPTKKDRHYNSALLLSSNGNVVDRYDKMHRVPFGEYVPMRDWLPFMDYLAPYDHDYSIRIGEKFTRFDAGKHKFGVLICFEDTDPFLARRYVQEEADGPPPVDFFVNISNDGWFDGTSEHEEHLAVSRFRAIECRRSLVRAVNMGVSAVIDGNGRVLKPELRNGGEVAKDARNMPLWAVPEARAGELPHAQWSSFKKVAGVLVATVPIDGRVSYYAMLGDWLPGLCWLVLAGVCVYAFRNRAKPQTAEKSA